MAKGVAGAVLIAALVIGAGTTAPAFARGGGGGGGSGGYSGGANTYGYSGYSDYPSGFSRGQGHGWSGGSYPPGWSHGQKRGWGDRGMPPGLYRRNYSNSYGY
jgi:hypothetical protein